MRLLFDMLTLCRKTGAGEYVRSIFYALLPEARKRDVNLTCLWHSDHGIAYADLKPEVLRTMDVDVADMARSDLHKIIRTHGVDRIFIGCAQYWHDVQGLETADCPVVAVVHDLSHEEKRANRIDEFVRLSKPFLPAVGDILRLRLLASRRLPMENVVRMVHRNPAAKLVAASDYTRHNLAFHYGFAPEKISVLYPPLRRFDAETERKACPQLDCLVESRQPYFMLTGCAHRLKNTSKAIHAFLHYVRSPHYRGEVLLAVGLSEQQTEFVRPVPFLPDAAFRTALTNCRALIYPSLFEGFGYPPTEAMRYGRPCLVSNATSMPEVCGNGAIYFSPLYESAVYDALLRFVREDYSQLCQRAQVQSAAIATRQERDTRQLIEMLLAPVSP